MDTTKVEAARKAAEFDTKDDRAHERPVDTTAEPDDVDALQSYLDEFGIARIVMDPIGVDRDSAERERQELLGATRGRHTTQEERDLVPGASTRKEPESSTTDLACASSVDFDGGVVPGFIIASGEDEFPTGFGGGLSPQMQAAEDGRSAGTWVHQMHARTRAFDVGSNTPVIAAIGCVVSVIGHTKASSGIYRRCIALQRVLVRESFTELAIGHPATHD